LSNSGKTVLVLGASGTIGQATVQALTRRGHEVVCFGRAAGAGHSEAQGQSTRWRVGDVTDPTALARDGIKGERFDALVSCLASRTGVPAEADAIDHKAHSYALSAAKTAGVPHMVLVSALCVQKPKLAFQYAKLAFEAELKASGLTYTIVRPTAFFKSLSGQVERVRRGKPFLVFGTGELTACKPISDDDLAAYVADSLDDVSRHNRTLPIGGPGDAITPRQQGEYLFRRLGRTPKFRHVPVRMLDAIVAGLSVAGRVAPSLAAKAEYARIGRYYATESMLVLNPGTGLYDADATPSTGTDTLFAHYDRLLAQSE
jgi:divinyl chlorophyllide a 8-vinyl-reductase